MFIFFTCIKKTNQQQSGERKCSRSLDPHSADYPAFMPFRVLLAKNGRHRKVAPYRALRRVADPFFAVLLGCVKRQKTFFLLIC